MISKVKPFFFIKCTLLILLICEKFIKNINDQKKSISSGLLISNQSILKCNICMIALLIHLKTVHKSTCLICLVSANLS